MLQFHYNYAVKQYSCIHHEHIHLKIIWPSEFIACTFHNNNDVLNNAFRSHSESDTNASAFNNNYTTLQIGCHIATNLFVV